MNTFKIFFLIFAIISTAVTGLFPAGTVICQKADGTVIVEGACDCEEETNCCVEDACHKDASVTESCHQENLCTSPNCFDTLLSSETYTQQSEVAATSKNNLQPLPFTDYLTRFAGLSFPLDVGKNSPPKNSSLFPQLTHIQVTVLLI